MLEKAVIVAMFVMSIHVMFDWNGMIFEPIAKWAERCGIPIWLKKPLYGCPICLVPWWGTPIYWLLLGNSVTEWVIVIFTAMGINSVVVWLARRQ